MGYNRRNCYIIGAGEFQAEYFHPNETDYLIAADGGLAFFEKMGIVPDLVIGDFDSMGKILPSNEYKSKKKMSIKKLPEEKDDTDLLAAIKEGLEIGCKEFYIFGGTGGRIDHTIANMQCLVFLSKRGCLGHLYGIGYEMTAITNDKIEFPPKEKGVIAVFSMGDKAEGVYLKGLKYELTNAFVTNDFPIGVSNEFLGITSTIEVQNGTLLIVHYL